MKQFTLKNFTLDDFASYLGGADNSYFDSVAGDKAHLVLEGQHTLSIPMVINRPLTISGSATINCNTSDFAISVVASDTTIRDITLQGATLGIEIDACGAVVQDVTISNVTVYAEQVAIEMGSSVSNSLLKNIKLEGCTVVVPDHKPQDGRMVLSYGIYSARHKSGTVDKLVNCTIDGVLLSNCKKVGESLIGVPIMCNMAAAANIFEMDTAYENNHITNVAIVGNDIDLCWDEPILTSAGFSNSINCSLTDLEVSHNNCQYGIGGVALYSAGGMTGNCQDIMMDNISIHHNTLVRGVADVGEPSRAISVVASKSQVLPVGQFTNNKMQNVNIYDNKLVGAGIAVMTAHGLRDGDGSHIGNSIDKVNITNNSITDAEIAFEFCGASFESRLFDWNFGYPRHNTILGAPIEDDSIVTMQMIDNSISHVVCTNNSVDGYRFSVKAYGANGGGHGYAKDNKVVDNVVFQDNTFANGSGHLHVANFAGYDYLQDAGGNQVSTEFFNKNR